MPIPLGLGALVVGALEYQKNWNGSRRRDRADVGMAEDGDEMIVRVRGPWQVSTALPGHYHYDELGLIVFYSWFLQVHVMGALPLRSLSRLWGYMNSFEVRPSLLSPSGLVTA